jgi:hypothetical protein
MLARKKDLQFVYQSQNYSLIKPYDTITRDAYAFPSQLFKQEKLCQPSSSLNSYHPSKARSSQQGP